MFYTHFKPLDHLSLSKFRQETKRIWSNIFLTKQRSLSIETIKMRLAAVLPSVAHCLFYNTKSSPIFRLWIGDRVSLTFEQTGIEKRPHDCIDQSTLQPAEVPTPTEPQRPTYYTNHDVNTNITKSACCWMRSEDCQSMTEGKHTWNFICTPSQRGDI